MNISKKRIRYLLSRYQNRECSYTEFEELFKWIQAQNNSEELNELMESEFRFPDIDPPHKFIDWESMLIQIQSGSTNKPRLNIRKLPLIAASVIFFLVTVVYTFRLATPPKNHSNVLTTAVQPAMQVAILDLGDGSQIFLADQKETISRDQLTIDKTHDGTLTYTSNQPLSSSQDVIYHTLTVPRNGKYKVRLSDHTLVWLNSGSSLTYPTQFISDDRTVTLKGEAYFEVAHDSDRPFLVRGEEYQIKVLGTHFNVMSYSDEPNTEITLVEGSVEVRHEKQQHVLTPGQQASISRKKTSLKIRSVDLNPILAWHDETFFFDDTPIEEALRQIERWYDVKINYTSDKPRLTFTGMISRKKTLNQVLTLLQRTSNVEFSIHQSAKSPQQLELK